MKKYWEKDIIVIASLVIIWVIIALTMQNKVCADYKKSCYISPIPTNEIVSQTVTPTVTINPSETPTPLSLMSTSGNGVVPAGNTSTTQPPGSPTCNIAFSPPVLTSITAGQSGQLTLNWLESSPVDKFSITYGLVGEPMGWGEDNIPATSRSLSINGLPNGSYINAQIYGWENRCPELSNILDPFTK
jgi:hypothetical protein